MKIFLVLISFFMIVGCNPTDTKSSYEKIASINVIGDCGDLENPSIYKNADSYAVEGWISVYTTTREIGYDTLGTFFVTKEERDKRWNSVDYESLDFNSIDAVTDTPLIEIYDISKDMVMQDVWKLSAVHNYDDTGEEQSIYAAKKAECTFFVNERQGNIPDVLLKKERWCLDPMCLSNEIVKRFN